MTVNITIVFQAINFFIGYFILERFLFRYTIAIIQKRDEKARMHAESLAFQNQSNETLRIHINEQWQRHQRALHSEIPLIKAPHLEQLSLETKQLESVDAASEKATAESLKKILYAKIVQE